MPMIYRLNTSEIPKVSFKLKWVWLNSRIVLRHCRLLILLFSHPTVPVGRGKRKEYYSGKYHQYVLRPKYLMSEKGLAIRHLRHTWSKTRYGDCSVERWLTHAPQGIMLRFTARRWRRSTIAAYLKLFGFIWKAIHWNCRPTIIATEKH